MSHFDCHFFVNNVHRILSSHDINFLQMLSSRYQSSVFVIVLLHSKG